MRVFVLLCSDLAIRSGTAMRIAPQHYNAEREELTFKTKYGENMTLPVTQELKGLFALHKGDPSQPYVSALHPFGHIADRNIREQFTRLRRSVGVTRQVTPHDLRRTTAVRTYELTKDLRLVQALLGHRDLDSTFWYLDHHNTPVPASTLELAKLNPSTEKIQ
jgi:integrase